MKWASWSSIRVDSLRSMSLNMYERNPFPSHRVHLLTSRLAARTLIFFMMSQKLCQYRLTARQKRSAFYWRRKLSHDLIRNVVIINDESPIHVQLYRKDIVCQYTGYISSVAICKYSSSSPRFFADSLIQFARRVIERCHWHFFFFFPISFFDWRNRSETVVFDARLIYGQNKSSSSLSWWKDLFLTVAIDTRTIKKTRSKSRSLQCLKSCRSETSKIVIPTISLDNSSSFMTSDKSKVSLISVLNCMWLLHLGSSLTSYKVYPVTSYPPSFSMSCPIPSTSIS